MSCWIGYGRLKLYLPFMKPENFYCFLWVLINLSWERTGVSLIYTGLDTADSEFQLHQNLFSRKVSQGYPVCKRQWRDHIAKWSVTKINNLTTQTLWFIPGVKLFATTFSLKVRRNLTRRSERRTREVNFNHSCQICLVLTHSCSLCGKSEGINSTSGEKQNNPQSWKG